ncbi:SURF1 family cytochrome oxidase biogenesis protein [Thermaurantiacus sp.]
MPRRWGVPLVPTLITAAALPILLGLGIWQLQRAAWKDGLVAALEAAPLLPPVALENPPPSADFRRAVARCTGRDLPVRRAGAAARDGRPGWLVRVTCPARPPVPAFEADLGWSPRPDRPVRLALDAELAGLLRDFGPTRTPRFRLVVVAPPPGLGLSPLKPLSAADLPRNHRAYAAQWFGFAAVLAAVWAAYTRRWRRGVEAPGPRS